MKTRLERAVIVVLDGVGVGEAPDAADYGDEGSNTIANVARAVGGLHLPHFQQLGLGNLTDIPGVPPSSETRGAYGRMQEASRGKDTTTGHWELAGLHVSTPFPTYPRGFPEHIIQSFERAIGRKTLGNKPASGTVIIEELGPRHLETGYPIVYTSADSVFQIAAHESVVPVDELYAMCQKARKILHGPHGVGRVIARPFTGAPGSFERTKARKDFSLEPPEPTLLDLAFRSGVTVAAVGKIYDIFAGRGITEATSSEHNDDTVEKTIGYMQTVDGPAIIFANCVDFDTLWGHRNDAAGFAQALQQFDGHIPKLMAALKPRDALFITSDHGCDPTMPGTDHSRELVPLFVVGPAVRQRVHLGLRQTFADLAATIAEALAIPSPRYGTSFWSEAGRVH